MRVLPFAKTRRCEPFLEWIRTLPCCACAVGAYRQSGRSEAAHVKTRGAGGDDVGNTVPLCKGHHQHQHRIGIRSFEATYQIELQSIAAVYGRVWRDRQAVAS